MLDQDTGVADERKTLVVVSDGITYENWTKSCLGIYGRFSETFCRTG